MLELNRAFDSRGVCSTVLPECDQRLPVLLPSSGPHEPVAHSHPRHSVPRTVCGCCLISRGEAQGRVSESQLLTEMRSWFRLGAYWAAPFPASGWEAQPVSRTVQAHWQSADTLQLACFVSEGMWGGGGSLASEDGGFRVKACRTPAEPSFSCHAPAARLSWSLSGPLGAEPCLQLCVCIQFLLSCRLMH